MTAYSGEVQTDTGEVIKQEFAIDSEFCVLIPPLSGEEYAQLENNLVTEGCREALIVWLEAGLLLDGHNRFAICQTHDLPYFVAYKSLSCREDAITWIVDHQLGRRNLTAFARAELALRKKTAVAAKARKNMSAGGKGVKVLTPLLRANGEIASEAGVSHETIRKVEEIIASAPESIKEAARRGDLRVDRAYRLTKALESAPEVVREIVVRDQIEQPDLVSRLTDACLKRRETWTVIVDTGTLDGERPIAEVSPTEYDEYMERLAYEHRQQANEQKRHERAQQIAALAGRTAELDPVRLGRFPVIYADPPWEYEHVKTNSRAVENHYPTLSLGAICALPVHCLATDDAVLFLWATSPKLFEAMTVLHCWGFSYRTCMVWVKDKIGMGDYARQRHELLLIGRRGEIPVPLEKNRPDSVLEAPRGKHSEKPAGMYEVIERAYPEYRRIELFSRSARTGWEGWGYEYPQEQPHGA